MAAVAGCVRRGGASARRGLGSRYRDCRQTSHCHAPATDAQYPSHKIKELSETIVRLLYPLTLAREIQTHASEWLYKNLHSIGFFFLYFHVQKSNFCTSPAIRNAGNCSCPSNGETVRMESQRVLCRAQASDCFALYCHFFFLLWTFEYVSPRCTCTVNVCLWISKEMFP